MKIRIKSTDMVNAPGMLRWCINGYRFETDRAAMLDIACALMPGVSTDVVTLVLKGEIAWNQVNETVEFEV
jgi:hypothetical protein